MGSSDVDDRLTELVSLVQKSFQRETAAAAKRGQKLISQLTVHDLHLDGDESTIRPDVGRTELLDSWRILVGKIHETNVFLDYLQKLSQAFREIDTIETVDYRHLKTLVDILTHAIENFHVDDSIECRFVTVLEVMMSYGDGWVPSEMVTHFWMRLMQELEPDITPINFRRKAYRVLVSLAWVPSSRGLLEACSFEARKQVIDFSKAPTFAIRSHVARIRGGKPRPRFDLVNQLLDRLKDETDVCIAISSEKEGMGKTTLAAHVASHPAILRVFVVLWLRTIVPRVGDEELGELAYDQYTTYLDKLCEQLDVEQEWPETGKRFEEAPLQRLREQELMLQAKSIMAHLLAERDSNYLLVLDDVKESSFVEWFRFSERQSVVVTTPVPDLNGVDWTVKIDRMSEEEAIELFLLEANLPKDHILGVTVEVRSILKRCEYNPLTVRTIARYYQLKQVTAGPVQSVLEVLEGLENLGASAGEVDEEGDPNMLLFDVLSFMMGPTRKEADATSVLFILTFAALVIVFPERAPLGEVLLLWEEVLKLQPHAIDELSTNGMPIGGTTLKKHVWFLAEGLMHMGVIDVADDEKGNPWVEVHHHLYKEFATLMAVEMHLKDSFQETVIQWNAAFVAAYFSQRIQSQGTKVDDNSWEYAIENLPSHMLKGKMLPAAESVLAEEYFFKARLEAMGWKRAMKVQVADCLALQRALNKTNGGSSSYPSTIFSQTAEMAKARAHDMLGSTGESAKIEMARLLIDLGFAQAETGYYNQGLALLNEAEDRLPAFHPLRATLLYGTAWALLSANETKKALQKIKACRNVMEHGPHLHELYKDMLQLVGNALVAECEYKESVEFYEVICEKMKVEAETSRVELGSTLYSKARLHHTMGELDLAEEVYGECLAWKQRIREKSKSMAMVHASLGDLLMELDRDIEALRHYKTALDLMDELKYDTNDLDYHVLKGKFLSLRGDYRGSSKVFEAIQKAIGRRPVLVLDKSAFDLRSIGRTYQARNDLAKAVELLHESLVLTLNRPYSLERASGLTDLGNCLLDLGEPSEGLSCLEKAMEIQIVKLGESTKVLESLKRIGNVHLSLHAYDDALVVFRKIYEITERLHAEDTERLAEGLYSIAEVFQAKKDHKEAISHFKLCMEVLKRDRPSHHPHIGKALQRLGDVSVANGDFDTAYDYYSQAYKIRKVDTDDASLAETQYSLGLLARKRGELGRAQELLLEALDTRRKFDKSSQTGETLLEIGNIYRLQNDSESAQSIYEKGVELLQNDPDDLLAARIDLAIGHVLLSNGDYMGALQRYTRVREKRLAVFGRDDLRTGNASRSLGLTHFLLDQTEEAMVHLNEFVRVYEHQEEDASETIDYAMAVLLLGDIHHSKGSTDQAKNMWTVAKEVCEDNEFEEGNPEFVALINRRLERDGMTTKKKKIFRLGSKELAGLKTDPKDVEVLQHLVFLDD